MPSTYQVFRKIFLGAIFIAASGILFHNYAMALYYKTLFIGAQALLFLGILLLVLGGVLFVKGMKEFLQTD